MKALSELKQDLRAGWRTVADGWSHLREHAANALTRFKPAEGSGVPGTKNQSLALTAPAWAMLAGEVFEDDGRIVVRIEVPGMEAKDFDLSVQDNLLVVRGEKCHSRETGGGRYQLRECAYGSFHRTILLPAAVRSDQAQASYQRGVLRVELPKALPAQSKLIEVKVG